MDENTLYRMTDAAGQEIVRLGSELETGIAVTGSGRWVVEPFAEREPGDEPPRARARERRPPGTASSARRSSGADPSSPDWTVRPRDDKKGPAASRRRAFEQSLDQNVSFAANWMLRSVVPQSEQAGFVSIDRDRARGGVADRGVRGC